MAQSSLTVVQDLVGHEQGAQTRASAALQAPNEQCSLFCVAYRLQHEGLSQKAFFGSYCWSWKARKHESTIANSCAGREGWSLQELSGGVKKLSDIFPV